MSVEPIAVVGLALRLPGARSVEDFWDDLIQDRESITRISDEDVVTSHQGDTPVPASHELAPAGLLDGIDEFDAGFFGYTAREAELMDPQQRLLLQATVEAFEDAGFDPDRSDCTTGVFVGIGHSGEFLHDLLPHTDLLRSFARKVSLFNDKGFTATHDSPRPGLTDPSKSLSMARSTSLATIHQACKSLIEFKCDTALAGGVSFNAPQRADNVQHEGGIVSLAGHCRILDTDARGTVFTSGASIVVLKRLSDALRDGDTIHAVIRGSAVNNDGLDKVGFADPSVRGQTAAVHEALRTAGVSADSIGYVEVHGTGAALGDPVEVTALTEAFRAGTIRNGYCALGLVTDSLGRLNAATGVAGFIKAVLCVEHGLIPPSLHYQSLNPQTDFTSSPFFVNTTTRQWPGDGPRRAGVSSFGMDGANAHLVVEQPPIPPTTPPTLGHNPHPDTTTYDIPESVGVAYTPPHNETQTTIVHILEDVLGTTPIGIHDDFFDLGCDSFTALQILTLITDHFGIELPHQTVLEASTVAQIAALIPDDQKAEPTEPSLVRLREGDERQVPLFLVHPVGGGLYFYKRLVRRLAHGQTVYGFQAAGLEGKSVPLRRVEDLATRYLRELRSLSLNGPIAIGGAAFGGLVALEMAQRLSAEGVPVHSLVLFDTPGPGQLPVNRHAGLEGKAVDELVTSRLAEHGLPASEGAMDLARPVFELYQANNEALHAYRPGTYNGPVLYFLAEQRRPGIDPEHPDQAWALLAQGEFTVHQTPGDYASLFQGEASIKFVAEILSGRLAARNGLRH